jgi:hypothetical protein
MATTTEQIPQVEMIAEGFKTMVQEVFKRSKTPERETEDTIRGKIYDLCPAFRSDFLFQKLYPSVYGIVCCERAIAKNKSK